MRVGRFFFDHGNVYNDAMTESDTIIETLRAHRSELERAGIRHLSLFGSMARGEGDPASDIDLAAEIEPEAGMDLVDLVSIERRLSELLGRKVDLLPEPTEQVRLQAAINRERRRAF